MNFSGYTVDKPTSKVLNPPGGRSSNIFGGAYEQEAAPVNRNKQTNNVLNDNSNINGNQMNDNTALNNPRNCNPDRYKTNDIFGNEHSNQAANKPRRGFNPITGKLYEEEQIDREKSGAQHVLHQQQQAEQLQQKQNNQPEPGAPTASSYHSSTRIHQPPGGKSTRLW